MSRILYFKRDKEYAFANKLEIISSYTGQSYGEVGETTDIKDTLTGEFLKVGDVVFYEAKYISGFFGISIIVKRNPKEVTTESGEYFIMGCALNNASNENFFNKIIKTSARTEDIRFDKSSLDFALEFKEVEQ